MMMRLRMNAIALGLVLATASASAQTRFLEVRYTPTKRAQVAIWVEDANGQFLQTLMLTEAVGYRGIGNRPGALQMNSGFRWPYGRREGVLPIWAHRRSAAPGAAQFPRVVFQSRIEGYASRTTNDQSRDDYFCLSFNDSNNENVDATTCASVFNSDKGRFMTDALVQAGYAEPYQATPGVTTQRALSLTSLYPMRRDLATAVGYDSPNVLAFAATARMVMPEIDIVTRATAPADATQLIGFEVPDNWPDGDYVVFVEVNTERDFDASWTEAMHPTPAEQTGSWDYWAANYGYAYRGQPSVLYEVPIRIEIVPRESTSATAVGYGSLEGLDGNVTPLDATIANNPTTAPGSGVDRLRLDAGVRVRATTLACETPPVIPAIPGFVASPVDDEKHSHEWASLRFQAIGLPNREIIAYRVKISTRPIVDDTTFVQAEDAKATTTDFQGLDLCPIDAVTGVPSCPSAGTSVAFDIGKLGFQTHYYVAVRAYGPCGAIGPIATADFETTAIDFTTVAPCFVATAAFGSPMHARVETLRSFRNRVLTKTGSGRAFVDAYYALGPSLAHRIDGNDTLRSVARALLRPFVQLAALVDRGR